MRVGLFEEPKIVGALSRDHVPFRDHTGAQKVQETEGILHDNKLLARASSYSS